MRWRVGINGFGRIGRAVARIISKKDADLDLVVINDLSDAKSLANLFEYDTTMGKWQGTVECVADDRIIINNETVKVTSIRNPAELPWGNMNVDIVLESTGVFRTRESKDGKPGYGDHLKAGARKVVLSAPAKDDIELMVVLGVNDDKLTPDMDCVSNASCTTNCLAPLAKVLHEAFGIEEGLMTTIHAYTNDQKVVDQIHRDPRRARAAACNIIPTTTGAAKSIGKVIPALDGKLNGIAIRVPVPVGSVVDFVVNLEREVTVEEVNEAVEAAAEGRMRGILEYCKDPIVSSDINNNPASSVFDSLLTTVLGGEKGKMVKVVSWYDNEWAYSMRTVGLMEKMVRMIH